MIKTILSILFLILKFHASAQHESNVEIAPPPSWVKDYPYKDEVKDTSNTSGGYYNLLCDDQYNTITQGAYHHYVQKILSENGLENISTLSMVFDPSYETLKIHEVKIIRNGLTIDQLSLGKFEVMKRETNLEKLVYNGNLTAIFNLQDLQVGDIVEYSYSYKGYNPVFNNKFSKLFYLDFSVPVGQVYCRLIVRDDNSVRMKSKNSPPEPLITKEAKQATYEWALTDVPAVLYEELTPGWYDPYKHIQISNFDSWNDVARWADKLYAPDVVAQGLISQISGVQKDNKEEAIRRVIQFVQDEIRYLSFSEGIHGYKPHPPARILKQRFGDCKDKSVLLVSLLNDLGVKASPVLINTSYGKALPDYLPSATMFDHCVVQFSFRDSIYWVDPTITLQRGPLNQLYFPSYGNGLAIDKNADDLSSVTAGRESSLAAEEEFYLDKIGGTAELTVTTTYTRQEANSIREYLKSNSLNEVEKQYLNFYATDYPGISKSQSFKWTDDEKKNVIISTESYHLESVWKHDSIAHKYTTEFYPRILSSYLIKPTTKIREFPFTLRFPQNIFQQITIHLPEDLSVSTQMKNIESSGFSYHSKVSHHDQALDLIFRYESKKAYLEKNEIKEHIAKIDEIYDDLNFVVTYADPNQQAKFNYPFLIILILVVAGSLLWFRYLYQWDPTPKDSITRYSSIGGWLILPAIGFCVSPIRMTIDLMDMNTYFNYTSWMQLTDSSYLGYSPRLGGFLLLELICNSLLLISAMFVLIVFFRRRSNAPFLIVVFYACTLAFLVVDALVGYLFFEVLSNDTLKSIAQSAVGAIIWIPYFLTSDRAKGTFTVRNKIPPDEQEIFRMNP